LTAGTVFEEALTGMASSPITAPVTDSPYMLCIPAVYIIPFLILEQEVTKT
jgi:hypothetical protein